MLGMRVMDNELWLVTLVRACATHSAGPVLQAVYNECQSQMIASPPKFGIQTKTPD